MSSIQKILCPIDFSECSAQALKQAALLAHANRAELVVLHAYWVPHYIQPNLLVWMATGARPALEIAEEQAIRDLDQFLESVDPALARSVRRELVHDDPASAIFGFCVREEVSLIVMGTHGRSGASRLVLGSVAERVVRAAPCPVLTLRKPESPQPRHATFRAAEAAR